MKESLTQEEIDGLVKYRRQRSVETMQEAKLMLDQGYLNGAVNRLYYACYYMVVALLLKNNISAQTHAGVKQMFGLHFVANQKLSRKTGSTFALLFEKRHSSDYDDFVYYDSETVELLYNQSIVFIETVEKLLD